MNINDLKIQNQEIKELDILMKSLEPPLFYNIPVPIPSWYNKRYYTSGILNNDEAFYFFMEQSKKALQKMHSCPYAWQVTYFKCTANPTNNNCLECKAYEHHDSTEMDS